MIEVFVGFDGKGCENGGENWIGMDKKMLLTTGKIREQTAGRVQLGSWKTQHLRLLIDI